MGIRRFKDDIDESDYLSVMYFEKRCLEREIADLQAKLQVLDEEVVRLWYILKDARERIHRLRDRAKRR